MGMMDSNEDFNYGLNGEVFVPDSLEDTDNNNQQQRENEPGITHGPHAERTALLREQARRRREEMGLSGEDDGGAALSEAFPALGAAMSGNAGGVGWSASSSSNTAVRILQGRNTTQLTEENFPSLGGRR